MIEGFENYGDERGAAFVKHRLLQKYLSELAYRVGRKWKSLVYVDAFAGPWTTSSSDLSDSSFGIAVKTLGKAQQNLAGKFAVHAYLIEKDAKAFPLLQAFANKNNGKPVKIVVKKGEFETHIRSIESYLKRLGDSAFRFLLLDPKGWKGLSMRRVARLVNDRSSEILVNVMVRHLRRFLSEDDRAESYREFFGRDGVREAVLAAPKEERADILVREYCRSLQDICGFKYVSSCLILNSGKDEPRYFLVFATNHHRGVEVFKDAETEASKVQHIVENDVRRRKRQRTKMQEEMPLFDDNDFLRRRKEHYRKLALSKVLDKLSQQKSMLYRDAFCEAAAFPLVTKKMILEDLENHPDIDLVLDQSKSTSGRRKKPNTDQDDYFIFHPANR